jgi:hypothetical protein
VNPARLPSVLPGAEVANVERFEGEELYNYMNGAAATYLEHGKVRMVSADVTLDGVASKVELYTMVSADAATKVYAAFAASDGGEELICGVAGTLWPSSEPEAIFHRQERFVRVMTYARDAATGKRVATKVALGIDRLLTEPKQPRVGFQIGLSHSF